MTELTVRSFLFGHDAQTVTPTLESAGVLTVFTGKLGPSIGIARQAMAGDLSNAVAGLLEIHLGGLVTEGWRTHRAFRQAAQATARSPHESRTVILARHTITSTHEPCVELLVNERTVYTLALTLTVGFEIESVTAKIEHARLVALQCGRSTVTATLLWQNHKIAKDTVNIDMALVVPLGDGIPLMTDTRRGR
jgi:hypothetical protein